MPSAVTKGTWRLWKQRGGTWPNLGPTWEVFLEEAELCSEQGRICTDPSPNQNLHDEGPSIVSDFTSSPATTHTHAGPVSSDDGDGMMVPAALYNSCLIYPCRAEYSEFCRLSVVYPHSNSLR